MNILPNSNAFANFPGPSSESDSLLNEPDSMFRQPKTLGSRKIVEIDKFFDIEDAYASTKEVKAVIVRIVAIKDKTIVLTSVKGSTAEEIEQAKAENKLGRIEETLKGVPVLRFPEPQTKELESLGITSVEVREPDGTARAYTSYNFQTLNDRELNLLITHVEAYIVFLKTQANPKDKKTEKTIHHLELKLKYLEIEREIRTNDPKFKGLLDDLIEDSPFKVAMRLAELWAQQKAITEKREEEKEQNFWETRHIIISKEIFRWELHLNLIKESVLTKEVDSHDLLNDFVKKETVDKNLMNIGHLINIYHALNKVE